MGSRELKTPPLCAFHSSKMGKSWHLPTSTHRISIPSLGHWVWRGLKLDPNPRLPVTSHPSRWVYDPKPDGQILALRHPGFGWLGFLIAQESADKMAGYLLKRATKSER
jgi:hypothetical protein